MILCVLIVTCALLHVSKSNDLVFQDDTRQGNVYITPKPNQDPALSRGITDLSISIAKMPMENLIENMVFAPINIASILSLLLLGSHGKSFDEIVRVLGLGRIPNIKQQSYRIHERMGNLMKSIDEESSFNIGDEVKLATALFVQNGFPIRNVFRQISEDIYRSEVFNVDFQSQSETMQTINSWVNEKTHSKISKMLEMPESTSTKLLIAAALYFKGAWEKPFLSGFTEKRPFYTNGRRAASTSMVDMMTNGASFPYYRDKTMGCEIIGLPYKGNKTTMYILIPKNSDKNELTSFVQKLSRTTIENLIDRTTYQLCAVAFPKMRLEFSAELQKPLKHLGLKSIFDKNDANFAVLSSGKEDFPTRSPDYDSVLIFPRFGEDDDKNCTEIFDPISNTTMCEEVDPKTNRKVIYKKFGEKVGRRVERRTKRQAGSKLDDIRSKISATENPGLYVDNILHKVYMDVTETGTEAAAATTTNIGRAGYVTFRADVPFLFFIWNNNLRTMLFWGTVTAPKPYPT